MVEYEGGEQTMIPNTEEALEMNNEIEELKEELHDYKKAIARIQHWHARKTRNENTNPRIIERETLETVLRIFKEEVGPMTDKSKTERREVFLNINDTAHVELTKYGEGIVRKHYAKCFGYRHAKAHEYHFPIWELMNMFGNATYMGANQCFVANKITVVLDRDPNKKNKGAIDR